MKQACGAKGGAIALVPVVFAAWPNRLPAARQAAGHEQHPLHGRHRSAQSRPLLERPRHGHLGARHHLFGPCPLCALRAEGFHLERHQQPNRNLLPWRDDALDEIGMAYHPSVGTAAQMGCLSQISRNGIALARKCRGTRWHVFRRRDWLESCLV